MNIAHINELDEEQSVEQHCLGAARIAEMIGSEIGICNMAYLATVMHDLGKETQAFTKYIKEQHLGVSRQRRGEINHSSAGAKYLTDLIQPQNAIEKLTCQLISYAIAAHHGVFDVITEEGEDYYKRRINPEKDIFFQEAVHNYQEYMSEEKIKKLFQLAVKETTNINESIKDMLKNPLLCTKPKEDRAMIYQFALGAFQRLLLSIVIDADRIDTNDFMVMKREEQSSDTDSLWKLFHERLEKYIDCLPKEGKIQTLRATISQECLDFAKYGSGIYRLSCPTGGGKTLASFRYAIEHAIQFNKKHIIYVAPYRAILEQNCEVIKTALQDTLHILEHHSDVIPEDNEQYQYLTERYTSEIIFTTMVQFLNILFSNQTRSIRRFHSLANSIIIVDEVQSIPVKCIHMFNQMMNSLSECYGTTIILCTATQPALENVKYPILFQNPKEMIQDICHKYAAFKRVNIVDARRRKGYDVGDLRQLIMHRLEVASSILVIVNTKSAARKCYEECKEYLDAIDDHDVLLFHLSTNMCPQHRMDCLDKLKSNLDKSRIICISTQLIEAGVDISFQCVIRSFTGLDSIAQAAGRCNRHGANDCEEVLIVNYNEENLSKLEDIKMGQQAIEIILDNCKDKPELIDEDLLSVKAMNWFYDRYYFRRLSEMDYSIKKWNTSIFDMLSTNKKGYIEAQNNKVNVNYSMRQAFNTAGKEFEVIDSNTTGILIPYEYGKELINDFNSINSKADLNQQFRLAQRYTINIYQHILHRLEEEGAIYELLVGGMYALKEGFYNKVTGLQLEGHFDSLIL